MAKKRKKNNKIENKEEENISRFTIHLKNSLLKMTNWFSNLLASKRTSQTINAILLILTLGIFSLGICQLRVIKRYQDWSIKEMSRTPNLSLIVNKITSIDSLIALEVNFSLKNTGNAIAKDVQIRTSTTPKEDNPLAKNMELTIEGPYISHFTEEGKKALKLAVWKYSELIYFIEKEGSYYSVKLPWTWKYTNVSPFIKTLGFLYTIDSNYGSFQDSVSFGNPYYGQIQTPNQNKDKNIQ